MSEKTTIKQLAQSRGLDPTLLLGKLRQSGHAKLGLDELIDKQELDKILKSLSQNKTTLSKRSFLGKKKPGNSQGHTQDPAPQRTPAAQKSASPPPSSRPGQSRPQQGTAQHRSAQQRSQGGQQRPAGQHRSAQQRSQGGQQRPVGQQRSAQQRSQGGQQRPVGQQRPAGQQNRPRPSAASRYKPQARSNFTPGKEQAPQKDWKQKGKGKMSPDAARAEKSTQFYGVRMSALDKMEIQEISKNPNMSNADVRQGYESRKGNLGIENKHGFIKPTEKQASELTITGDINFNDFAHRLAVKRSVLLRQLIKSGVLDNEERDSFDGADFILDKEVAIIAAEELGFKVKLEEAKQRGQAGNADLPADAKFEDRPPIITVMGHVDHGKTTLLDFIRKSKQAETEAGKITQHFGAYSVPYKGRNLTFFDTPGHAAFSEMRARGAKLTDIVILVVAGDDGIKEQTVEAIKHAQAAEAEIVVAINKMDLETADAENVMKDLASQGLQPEAWGGNIQCVEISATTGKGVDALLEATLAQADIMELKAAVNLPGRGNVIEANLDKGIGPVVTIILEHGEIKQGDTLACGEHWGRIKMLRDDQGKSIKTSGPGIPCNVLGLSGVPLAGESCLVVANEKEAKRCTENAKEQSRPAVDMEAQDQERLENLEKLLENEGPEQAKVNLIIKTDVTGSLEAIKSMITGLAIEQAGFEVVSSGVGAITESDINLARATSAIMIGFNVRPDSAAKRSMKSGATPELHFYNVIYELAEELTEVLDNNAKMQDKEKIVGIAKVKEVFSAKRFGQIAGCEVSEGTIFKDKPIRVLRDNKVIYEGVLESLRRFKENVKEVREGVECGIGVKDYRNVKVGDQIEVYERLQP